MTSRFHRNTFKAKNALFLIRSWRITDCLTIFFVSRVLVLLLLLLLRRWHV
jgi:hypothetical protein